MTSHKAILAALYDAHSELALYSDPALAELSRKLGGVLGSSGIGAICRAGSPTLNTALLSHKEKGGEGILLSPAASRHEHEKAFRLPEIPVATVFTGRGALGADVMAIESAHAAFVLGSDEEALLGIFGCIGGRDLPIAILSQEDPMLVRDRIIARYPKISQELYISDIPEHLAKEVASILKRRHSGQ
jgi:hypothetical protein